MTPNRLRRRRRNGARRLAMSAIAMVTAWASVAWTQEAKDVPLAVTLGKGSELRVEGSSTIHDWESRTEAMTISLTGREALPAGTEALDSFVRATKVGGLTLTIPVASMKSGKDGLDKNMRKALKEKEFPNIVFKMSGYEFLNGSQSADTMSIRAKGSITVTGVTRPENVQATLVRDGKGLWLEGSKDLRMTDFEVRPPTMMMGTLRTKDEITIHYRLLLVSTAESADATEATNP